MNKFYYDNKGNFYVLIDGINTWLAFNREVIGQSPDESECNYDGYCLENCEIGDDSGYINYIFVKSLDEFTEHKDMQLENLLG